MLTLKQRVEWFAFTKIRGPIGAHREDYYNRFQAQHTRLSMVDGQKFGPDDFRHPWEPEPEPRDVLAELDAEDDED